MQDMIALVRDLRRLTETQAHVLAELERAVTTMNDVETRASTPSTTKRPTVNRSDYLTPKEVAEILQVSPKTIYQYIAERKLRAADFGYQTKRIRGNELKRFLREHEEEP